MQVENNDKTKEGRSDSADSPAEQIGAAQQMDSYMDGISSFEKAKGPEVSHTDNDAKYFTCPSGEIAICILTGDNTAKQMAATSIMAFERMSLF